MKATPLGSKGRREENAMHGNCKRACYAQRKGVEGNCPGTMGRGVRSGLGHAFAWRQHLGLLLPHPSAHCPLPH